MNTAQRTECNRLTKIAWDENWREITVAQIQEIFSYVRVKKQMDVFLRYLPKGEKILEGGCGLCPYVIRLRELGYDVIGSDYNVSPLQKVKSFNAGIPLVNSDILKLPFRDGSFGAYLSLGVLEHFAEGPVKAICEAQRILKKEGMFIVQIPINNLLKMLRAPIDACKRNALLRRITGKAPKVFYWEQYMKPLTLKKIFEENGFNVLAMLPIDHTHNLCTFCPGLFRDKQTYDEANPLGIRVGAWLERKLPWATAAEVIYLCRKR